MDRFKNARSMAMGWSFNFQIVTLVAGLLCGALFCGPAVCVRAASPEQVDKAIEDAIHTLYALQKNGNWEIAALADSDKGPYDVDGGQWGGLTSIATYALLAAGESPQDARIRSAVEWLKKADIKGVYALGMRLQVWNFLPKTEVRVLIEHDAKLLLLALKSKDNQKGFFDYLVTPSAGYDHSVSQYGVLGLWAAAEAEQPFEVPEKFWELVEQAWLRDQDKTGGWAYHAKPEAAYPLSMAMTAAGVASLFITQDYVHGLEGVTCKGNIHNPGIEAGIKWMGEHFSEIGENLYAWYGIERIGVASGLKYIGTIDWYREGCNRIVPMAPSWNAERGPVPGTSFALLFMVRGRGAVLMNKLDYELNQPAGRNEKVREAHWNQRPRDAANVTRFIGHEREKFYNWQIVNLKVPEAELHDAPIMYIAGDQALDMKKDDEAKLRLYVEQGGLILCNADCNSQNFLNSILKSSPGKPSFAQRLFPGYEVRKLPNDHPIYTAEMFQRRDWKQPVDLMAVGNGSREFMLVFSGADPAQFWQTRTFGGRESFHQIMANIFLYATENSKSPRFKGKSYIVTQNIAVKAARTMKVARLEYSGNWNPEPGGWRRIAAYMHNNQSLDLTIDAIKLGDGKLTPDYKAAHLTGNVSFHLSDKQRAEVKAFTDAGGLLIVDSCGGSGEFTSSVEAELGKIFPEDSKNLLTPLPFEDSLYSAPRIEEVSYRRAAQRMLVGKLKSPQIRSIVQSGKTVLYYSPQDLSVGIVGQDVDGIFGYSPATATELMRNMLLKAGGFAPMAPVKVTPVSQPAAPTAVPAKAPEPAKPKDPAPKPAGKLSVPPKK